MATSSRASVPAVDARPDPARLLAALRRHLPGAAGVGGLRAVSGGASQEIWSFDASLPSGLQGVILRRSRRWSDAGQQGSAGMATEAALLRRAAIDGVRVPGVIGELVPADALGEGYWNAAAGLRTRAALARRERTAALRRARGGARGLPQRQSHRRRGRRACRTRLGTRASRRSHGGPGMVLRQFLALRPGRIRSRRSGHLRAVVRGLRSRVRTSGGSGAGSLLAGSRFAEVGG